MNPTDHPTEVREVSDTSRPVTAEAVITVGLGIQRGDTILCFKDKSRSFALETLTEETKYESKAN